MQNFFEPLSGILKQIDEQKYFDWNELSQNSQNNVNEGEGSDESYPTIKRYLL